tara:strand:+ start:177 stop:470 length:294 start_codon:yes stop_codon:yes gene_type:complete
MQISQKKLTLLDFVFAEMRNCKPWTFWELQEAIRNDFGNFYGEPTISAAIRELRKPHARIKYNLPQSGEVVLKERRLSGKGYTYRLAPSVLSHWKGS